MKENIIALRQKRGKAIDQMEAQINAASAAGRGDLNADEKAIYDAAKLESGSLATQITRAEEVQRLKAESATDLPGQGAPAPSAKDGKREKGERFSRFVRCLAVGKGDRRRGAEFAEQVLHDAEVAKALGAGTFAAGGALVPEDFASEFIELLYAATVVRRMGARPVPMPNGNLTMPGLAGGASGGWIGENQNATKTEQTFRQLKMAAKKYAAIVPVSNDLIRFSSPNVDSLIREDLVSAVALAEDLAFIRSQGTADSPKGLRYWAPTANVLAVNATVNLANVTQDLGRCQLALMNANVRMLKPGWLMAPRSYVYLNNLRDGNGNKAFPETDNMMLKGYPIGMTTQIPTNLAVTDTSESEIYFVDFADCLIGEAQGVEVTVSDVAAYHDGSNVVAAFSQDQTVIRILTQVDFGVRHTGSVAVLKDVDWA